MHPVPGDRRSFLKSLFDAAVEAADPRRVLAASLPDPGTGGVVVVGAGKASAGMAAVAQERYGSAATGVVVTRYGHGGPCENIEVLEAGHPVPDGASVEASRRVLQAVAGLDACDTVVCLLSGGGSALLTLPAGGVRLEDKQLLTRELLLSGAGIEEINCVRKHLSGIKGGRLAVAAHPARVVTLAISDVPGDNPSSIASGPTVADPTTFADAEAVLERYSVPVPCSVAAHLAAGAGETPKPGDPVLAGGEFHVVAGAERSLSAAADAARKLGVEPFVLDIAITGESRLVGLAHAAIAMKVADGAGPVEPPCVILSGGETTVTVRGGGRGGNNTEFLLALVTGLSGRPGISAIACDTDGIDGTGTSAGAMAFPDTLARAASQGLDAAAFLEDNDSVGFFGALGDLVETGPTGTNVSDFRAVFVEEVSG